MSDDEQDKGGADAGQKVIVHDRDPVRPAPPKSARKKSKAEDSGEDE